MPPEAVYNFSWKNAGEDGFGRPYRLHTHKGSSVAQLVDACLNKSRNACFIRIGMNDWQWCYPKQFASAISQEDRMDSFDWLLHGGVQRHVLWGHAFELLEHEPEVDIERYLVPIFEGVSILKVPKPNLW